MTGNPSSPSACRADDIRFVEALGWVAADATRELQGDAVLARLERRPVDRH